MKRGRKRDQSASSSDKVERKVVRVGDHDEISASDDVVVEKKRRRKSEQNERERSIGKEQL